MRSYTYNLRSLLRPLAFSLSLALLPSAPTLLGMEGSGMMIASRNGMAVPKPLPYDAEVEYLESTGTQWIDTGIHATQNTTAKIKCAWMTVANDNPVFGADNGGTWNGSYILMHNTGIRFIKGGPTNVFAQQSWIQVVAERMYEIECLEDGIKQNGNFAAFNSTPATTVYTNKTIPLYAWWRQAQPWPTKCRIAYVSFAESGSTIRDFIPVRFTNELGESEGAMYDRVSGALFRNQGTGAFVFPTA